MTGSLSQTRGRPEPLNYVKCWRCGGRGFYPVARIRDGQWTSEDKVCQSCALSPADDGGRDA